MCTQPSMGVTARIQHLQKKPQTLLERQFQTRAVLQDRVTINPLHGEIGMLRVSDARVIQLCDVGMRECAEDVPFPLESAPGNPGQERALWKLQSDVPVRCPIRARGQPDLAHATLSKLPFQDVGSNSLTREKLPVERSGENPGADEFIFQHGGGARQHLSYVRFYRGM